MAAEGEILWDLEGVGEQWILRVRSDLREWGNLRVQSWAPVHGKKEVGEGRVEVEGDGAWAFFFPVELAPPSPCVAGAG